MQQQSHEIWSSFTDIVMKVEHYLGGKLDSPPTIHVVRDVAPAKLMLCVSFRVPENVAFNGRGVVGEGGSDVISHSSSRERSPRDDLTASAEESGKRQKTE